MTAIPDTVLSMDGYTKVVTAVSVTLGAIYGAIRLAAHFDLSTRIRRRFRRKPAPIRVASALARRETPARRFVSIENAHATGSLAEAELERIRREGLRTETKRRHS